MIRLPGICNFDSTTTVLAHFRMVEIPYDGHKPPDLIGSWSCSACHNEADRRTTKLEKDFVRMAFLEGVIRTQAELIKMGLVKW
jgi:hypothetical protein